ncbi:MAG: KTSC domain-containing protein [Chthoniobacterales bacterium]
MKSPPMTALLALLCIAVGPLHGQGDRNTRSRIRRIPVHSSNVTSLGYSRGLHALEIEFARGAIYRFQNVPPHVYRDFLASKSKGHFVAENIRGHYDFRRMRNDSGERTTSRGMASADK